MPDGVIALELAADMGFLAPSAARALARNLTEASKPVRQQRADLRFKKPVSAKARKASKAAAHREETAKIRAKVIERSGGRCESPTCPNAGSEIDHWRSGSGRRRAEQSPETCWLICAFHHVLRTANSPHAAFWNQQWATHCIKHGYDFLPHVEKQITRKGEASP